MSCNLLAISALSQQPQVDSCSVSPVILSEHKILCLVYFAGGSFPIKSMLTDMTHPTNNNSVSNFKSDDLKPLIVSIPDGKITLSRKETKSPDQEDSYCSDSDIIFQV